MRQSGNQSHHKYARSYSVLFVFDVRPSQKLKQLHGELKQPPHTLRGRIVLPFQVGVVDFQPEIEQTFFGRLKRKLRHVNVLLFLFSPGDLPMLLIFKVRRHANHI